MGEFVCSLPAADDVIDCTSAKELETHETAVVLIRDILGETNGDKDERKGGGNATSYKVMPL